MSQVNNITGLSKIRPVMWQEDRGVDQYMTEVELWAKQVYENLTGITQIRVYTVAELPDASDFNPSTGDAALLYVSDETGGAVPAFSDGTNWRRVTDRAIVS